MDKKAILIFGVGELQRSIIERAKLKNLFVVGIDPCENAAYKDLVDAFEVVGGQDFEGTLAVAKKYNISAVITAATDKPLVMMARIAQELNLPFYSIETAMISTDKYLMKKTFQKIGIQCAGGELVSSIKDFQDYLYPVIIKPRDNSGSRGVVLCNNYEELKNAYNEAKQYTKKNSVLIEEFIEGKEYSIESLHYNGKTRVIQFTEKRITPFPYNVELGHFQPACLSEEVKTQIESLIEDTAECFGFKNCASHTELKISEKGIFIIETSPRLGGDYITSHLVPLSTGINIEDVLLDIGLGIMTVERFESLNRKNNFSSVAFFDFGKGVISKMGNLIKLDDICVMWNLSLKEGDVVPLITNSLDRYGFLMFVANDLEELKSKTEEGFEIVNNEVLISAQ